MRPIRSRLRRPFAARCTLRDISCVAAPCSSTATAMVEEISDKLALRSAHKPKRVGEKLRSAEIA